VVFSIAVGVFSIGVIAGAYQIIGTDLRASYSAIKPSNIELRMAANFDDDLLEMIRNRDGVAVRGAAGAHGDEAASLLNLVEGAAVGDEILDDRKRVGAEGLDGDGGAVGEAAHVSLAARNGAVRTVGLAVDDQRARAADPFAAVVGERNRILALALEVVVDDVEHLEERHVRIQVRGLVFDKFAGLARAGLAPDPEGDRDELGGGFGDHGKE